MPEFSVVMRGYDRRQVDELVARVEGTLGRAPLFGQPITLKEFGWFEFDIAARGYDRFEVDGAMRTYRRELAAYEGVELPPDVREPDPGLGLILGTPAETTDEEATAPSPMATGGTVMGGTAAGGTVTGGTAAGTTAAGGTAAGAMPAGGAAAGGMTAGGAAAGGYTVSVASAVRGEHSFPVRFRGYDRAQVHDLIARIWGTLGRAPLNGLPVTREELNNPRLDVVVRGYDRLAVEEALGRYLREFLERR